MRECKTCPLRATCQEICPEVEALLPAIERGRLCSLRRGTAKFSARRLIDEMETASYLTSRRDVLTGLIREVFDLRYNEGLSQAEIAGRLGVHPRTVSRWLEAARQQILQARRN
jgi:DNA-directed RNA polymerase specialized sigma subunit